MTHSANNRLKMTCRQLQQNYELQHYIENIKTVPHRICLGKFRLGCHVLRIQTGKYECIGGPIPVESRTCQQCCENVIKYEQHFLVNCKTFESISQNYFNLTEQKDPCFIVLENFDKTEYLMQAAPKACCKEIGTYVFNFFTERSYRQNKRLPSLLASPSKHCKFSSHITPSYEPCMFIIIIT